MHALQSTLLRPSSLDPLRPCPLQNARSPAAAPRSFRIRAAAAAPKQETDPKKRVGISLIDRFDSKFPTRFGGQIRGCSTEGYIDGKNDRRLDDCLRYCIAAGEKALEPADPGGDSLNKFACEHRFVITKLLAHFSMISDMQIHLQGHCQIMESLEHAMKRGAPIIAEDLGGAVNCDAYHMTDAKADGLGVSSCIQSSIGGSNFLAPRVSFGCPSLNRYSYFDRKLFGSRIRRHGSRVRRRVFRIYAMDDDNGFSSFDDWGESSELVEYVFSSSDGEGSDGEIVLQPITDVDLPSSKEEWLATDESLRVTAHRFGMLSRTWKQRKNIYGILNNVGLVLFSTFLLLLVDQCAWRIVRLPLPPFHLIRPFLISVILVASAGYVCVPLFRMLNIRSVVMKMKPSRQYSKKLIPTMGGLYLVPIGLLVAEVVLNFSSIEVSGAATATIAFAVIGILVDSSSIKNNNNSLPGWMRLLLEAAAGTWFSYWSYTTNISTPYSMKMVVPLPAPLGLICLRKSYPVLTSFCFVSMSYGMNLTNRVDGLAAGTAALAFIGMSIVVLPICSDLSVFGASMAGACIGFLFQNRHRASILMGDTGALALGGALAAMASCTGMFFPLFVSSGVIVLESLSVATQAFSFKATKFLWRRGFRLPRTVPLHRHLVLHGIKEPTVIAAAYILTSALTLCAAYIGLISA